MDKLLAQQALTFLSRATLTGSEVGNFVAVINALNAIINPPVVTIPEITEVEPQR